MSGWPCFSSHKVAACWHCMNPLRLWGAKVHRSGFAHGNGGWVVHCRTCGHANNYDVQADVDQAKSEERKRQLARERSDRL